jgi:hypothetical protein
MLDQDSIPIPVTSNNWHPIEFFNQPHYKDHGDFLVWVIDPTNGEGMCFVAQYAPVDIEAVIGGDVAPFEDTPYHITGEWRHIEEFASLEPVAFRDLPEGPDLDRLKQIVTTYPDHKVAA